MELIDFILHVDEHLLEFITQYGVWIYAILFLIIFVETGLVVMPFLPGDSLLFAAGALAASTGVMDPWILGILLFTAAVYRDWETDRKSTRLNSSHSAKSRMPSSA